MARQALWCALASLAVATLTWAGIARHEHVAAPPLVYGEPSHGSVCTAQIAADGGWVCETSTVLVHGQSAARARPGAAPCLGERVADQRTGRWVCSGPDSSLA